ncbi:MAG: protein kinase, partial [Phycisphaerales bacterium]
MKESDPHSQLSIETESLVANVVNDFLQRLESGERPKMEEYTNRHPEIADVLREVLSTLQTLETVSLYSEHTSRTDNPDRSLKRTLGDFRIIREIGRGGMGVVYEAEQISLDRRVALKVLPFAAVLDDRRLQRFKTEARAAAQLHHTNIIPVFSVGCERGVHYYAMQYVEGHTRAAGIRALRELSGLDTPAPDDREETITRLAQDITDGRFEKVKLSDSSDTSGGAGVSSETPSSPIETLGGEHSTKKSSFFRSVATLGIQAAEALECAHAIAIVHRDIKPSNLLLDARGHLWMTDFGLAQFQTDMGMTLTMPGDVLGTLRYMSPEQALGEHTSVDHRTDIYSLGVTLYELLTLEPVFTGKDRPEILSKIADKDPRPPKRINEAIPTDLETIVLKSIAKEPKSRYATAQEMADDLRRFLDDKPIKAKRPTLIARAIKWRRRHRALALAAVIVVIGTILNVLLVPPLFFSGPASMVAGRTIFVDAVAAGHNDGSGWANAFTHLQDALAVAEPGDEICVAKGIYRPDRDSANPNGSGDRTISFQLKNGVIIKGGYAGLKSPGTRDIELHVTILSGDLAGDDGPDFANNGENSYHVVTGSDTDETAVLDGFTITGGNADGRSALDDDWGGGMYNKSGSPTVTDCTFSENAAVHRGGGMANTHQSNPITKNCTYTGNQAVHDGGGMMNDRSNPILTNCMFTGNSALNDEHGLGGGMYNYDHSRARLTNCTFVNNWAGWGGGAIMNRKFSNPTFTKCALYNNRAGHTSAGMYNQNYSSPILVDCIFVANGSGFNGGGMENQEQSNPVLTNCTFRGNTAGEYGAGMLNTTNSNPIVTNCSFIGNSTTKRGGGIENNSKSKPVLTSCIFNGNSADVGGGMFNNESSPTVSNCTFTGNRAIQGGGIHNLNSSPRVTNCILWGNSTASGPQIYNDETSSATVSYCNVQGGYPGRGNISADPMFVDANGPDDIVGTMDDNLRLAPGSPCADAGDNSALPMDIADIDADGDTTEPIMSDCDGKPRIVNNVVDIGAYEYLPLSTTSVESMTISAQGSGTKGDTDPNGERNDSSERDNPAQVDAKVSAGNSISDPNRDEMYIAVRDWSDKGFVGPHGILVDSADNVYVMDTFGHSIKKFDSDGNLLANWGTFGVRDGQFGYPRCAAVDNSGNIYVNDAGNHRIQKLDSSGNFIDKWNRIELRDPWGIAIHGAGVVYVTGLTTNNVMKFDTDGNFIAKWGTFGSGDGQFNRPHGITLDSDGNVYVVDNVNNRIQKFDSAGNFLTKWGTLGTDSAQFDRPEGLA